MSRTEHFQDLVGEMESCLTGLKGMQRQGATWNESDKWRSLKRGQDRLQGVRQDFTKIGWVV
jgi:hypothetical protein